ncbi:MAG: RDD family protein [Paracoccaceae bacterium]
MKLWRRRDRPRKTRREKRILESFLPPEGVPLRFEVAGLGARIGAQIIDILLAVTTVLALLLALGYSGIVPWTALVIIGSLLFFGIRVPYHALSELLWNGQTLGKRLTHLRVISADGRSLQPHAVAVRNLMKEMEVFVPAAYIVAAPVLSWQMQLALFVWIAILVTVPLMNRKRQRFGDILANTYVVFLPKPLLLPDVASVGRVWSDDGQFVFLPHQLDHYGKFELQTLEALLQTREAALRYKALQQHRDSLRKVAETIRRKIGYSDRVPDTEIESFLRAFYRAQRAYLENRKLFGDAREDKFHGDKKTGA